MPLHDDAPATAAQIRRRLTRRLFFGLPLVGAALAARPTAVEAGTSTSSWKMEGNSDVDSNDFIGSKNDIALVFKTKNIERLRITNAGRVGVGTASPDNTLHVVALPGGITTIRGDTGSTDGRAAGVLGRLTGAAPTGAGVKGVAAIPQTSVRGPGYGVWGQHEGNGFGVYGLANSSGLGVVGISGDPAPELDYQSSGTGVQGTGAQGVIGRGSNAGVIGMLKPIPEGTYLEGFGVYGLASGRGGTGVYGSSTGPGDQDNTGPFDATYKGVEGFSNRGFGVVGKSAGIGATGVYGEANSGVGIVGESTFTGIIGDGLHSIGMLGIAGVNLPVRPSITQGWMRQHVDTINAPLGNLAPVGVGVRGVGGSVGVAGSSQDANGIGVLGVSPTPAAGATGYGVYGKASAPAAFAGYFQGKVQVEGALQVGTGATAQYVVTAAQNVASFSGNVQLDSTGQATVTLPAGSPALTDVRYQLTAVGAAAPGLYIAQELANGAFRIAGGPANLKVSWRIEGVR